MNVAVVKTGPGVNCPDGHRIQKLLVGQPLPPIHEVGTEKGQEHVTAAEKNRAHLEEKQRELEETNGGCGQCTTDGRGREKKRWKGSPK